MEKRQYYDPGFNGTEEYHRVSIFPGAPVVTDSVIHFCEEKKAFWLMDVIASYSGKYNPEFSVAFFDLDGKDGGLFHIHDDYDSDDPDAFPATVSQEIEYTDLDVNVKLYIDNGVVMFPSAY